MSYIQFTAFEFGFGSFVAGSWEVRGQTPVGSFLAEPRESGATAGKDCSCLHCKWPVRDWRGVIPGH